MGTAPKARVCISGGAQKTSALFPKIFWEETEKQKTLSRRAQEFPRSRAQWKGQEWEQCTERVQPARENRTHKSKDGPNFPTETPRGGSGRNEEWRHRIRLEDGGDTRLTKKGESCRGCWRAKRKSARAKVMFTANRHSRQVDKCASFQRKDVSSTRLLGM